MNTRSNVDLRQNCNNRLADRIDNIDAHSRLQSSFKIASRLNN